MLNLFTHHAIIQYLSLFILELECLLAGLKFLRKKDSRNDERIKLSSFSWKKIKIKMNDYSYEHFDLPEAFQPNEASPWWNNKADNAWQLTATTMVCLQSVPGLVILYGSMVKKKWAVNSAFMAFYAFAVVLVCWVLWAHQMAFGSALIPLMGKPDVALSEKYLLEQSGDGKVPMADYVFFQFAFAAITVVLLAGSLLGRMNFYAWMIFVPLWLTFSYTIGAFTIWGGGFLEPYIIDYAGGFVIHLSSGVSGFTAAYWVIFDMHT